MSQIEVERFLGRLITDAEFRKNAADSLEKCCFEEGFILSGDERMLLEHFDFFLVERLSAALDDALKRS